MGDGLKAWAAQVRQQAAGRHASSQAGRPSLRHVRQGADWVLWLGAAELWLRQGGPTTAYGQVSPGKVILVF